MNIQLTDDTLLREIGQIADDTRRTPDQVVTEALELYIRRLSETPASDKYKGFTGNEKETGQMTLERIMDKTISVLRYFMGNADAIMARLEPGQDSGLLELTNRLADRLNAVEDEADLVAIANIVYDLIIRIPHFPPDESLPQHFQIKIPKQMSDDTASRHEVERHKTALREVLEPCFRRIEQAWRDIPSPVPPEASASAKTPPWDLMGIFQDDPTWPEIEQERDRELVPPEGEAE